MAGQAVGVFGEVAGAVRERLKLPADAGKAEVLLALSIAGDGSSWAELATMRAEAKERSARDLLQPYVERNVITPAQYENALALARESPDRLVALLKNAVPVVAPGPTRPPSSRSMLIGRAMREYRDTPAHRKATDLRPFVDQSLRDAGLAVLTADEAKELSVG